MCEEPRNERWLYEALICPLMGLVERPPPTPQPWGLSLMEPFPASLLQRRVREAARPPPSP